MEAPLPFIEASKKKAIQTNNVEVDERALITSLTAPTLA
jgi:hypothetical protein